MFLELLCRLAGVIIYIGDFCCPHLWVEYFTSFRLHVITFCFPSCLDLIDKRPLEFFYSTQIFSEYLALFMPRKGQCKKKKKKT